MELAQHHGIARPTVAVDALQEELAQSQGRIDWLQAEADRRPHNPSLLAVCNAERNCLRQSAAGMVTAKTDERRATLNKRQLDLIEAAVTATLRDFGSTPVRTPSVGRSSRGWVSNGRQLSGTGIGASTGRAKADNQQRLPGSIAF